MDKEKIKKDFVLDKETIVKVYKGEIPKTPINIITKEH